MPTTSQPQNHCRFLLAALIAAAVWVLVGCRASPEGQVEALDVEIRDEAVSLHTPAREHLAAFRARADLADGDDDPATAAHWSSGPRS